MITFRKMTLSCSFKLSLMQHNFLLVLPFTEDQVLMHHFIKDA